MTTATQRPKKRTRRKDLPEESSAGQHPASGLLAELLNRLAVIHELYGQLTNSSFGAEERRILETSLNVFLYSDLPRIRAAALESKALLKAVGEVEDGYTLGEVLLSNPDCSPVSDLVGGMQ